MAEIYNNANKLAAYAAADMSEMDAATARVESAIKALAAEVADTGDFARSIHTERGRIDRHIESSDPGAMAIEFGHVEGGTYVPGKYVFTRIAKRGI